VQLPSGMRFFEMLFETRRRSLSAINISFSDDERTDSNSVLLPWLPATSESGKGQKDEQKGDNQQLVSNSLASDAPVNANEFQVSKNGLNSGNNQS